MKLYLVVDKENNIFAIFKNHTNALNYTIEKRKWLLTQIDVKTIDTDFWESEDTECQK